MTDAKIRLQKFMADSGVASRRKSEELIAAGKVKVNGKVAAVGDKVDPKHDKVVVGGKKIVAAKGNIYIMLNKPRGFITTMSDEMDRKCVAELIKDIPQRVYPVGRLDRESEGLLLMTNDGEFANALTHPSKHVPKTYRVTIRPSLSKEQKDALENGVMVDGRVTLPSEVRIVERQEGRVVIELTIYEGRNRQIRKMCENLGLEVARLKRTKIGSLKMGMLKQGDYRNLTQEEVHSLMAAAQISENMVNK